MAFEVAPSRFVEIDTVNNRRLEQPQRNMVFNLTDTQLLELERLTQQLMFLRGLISRPAWWKDEFYQACIDDAQEYADRKMAEATQNKAPGAAQGTRQVRLK